MEEVEEAALLPAAPTLRSGKLDRPVQYKFFRRFGPTGMKVRGTGEHDDAVLERADHNTRALLECAACTSLR